MLDGEPLAARLENATIPIPVFKEALREFRADLEKRFYDGEDVELLIQRHAAFVDEVLRLAWQRFDWQESRGSWWKHRISLVAVGGYGRGELHPFSDIDLLVLLERGNYQRHASNIQSFLTLCWDIGLEVGHSVRSIKECKTQAKADVTVLTALMESRTICGDEELRANMEKAVGSDRIWPAEKFFKAKSREQRERHRKSDHTEYSLEPNVKTSPGGLRDEQTVMWIARRKFGTVRFDDLVTQQFITPEERDVLRNGQALLWRIRFGLHLISGRDDDRLLFEHQPRLAKIFGYEDGDQLAVEQFMQSYYRTAQEVNTVCELLLQNFEEAIVNPGSQKVTPINERFQLRNNFIEVTADDVFEKHPPALLELFLIYGQSGTIEGMRASTIRLMRQHVHLIDDAFRKNPVVTDMFIELLRDSESLFSTLRMMGRYGILGAYLPEFGRVIGQMQFDLFHIYTVDAHTLQVVRNMRRFRYRNQEQRFPIAAHIYPRLPKIELLFIAGLYHDIGKGQGGDHSELGEVVARDFCERHGLGLWDANLVCWLVLHHLEMSSTAQRKDISDPEVIREFALFVQDQVRLDYLYALTVADINATNPTLWNSWRASLMRQLYLETKKLLRHGLENQVDRNEYIQENRNHALTRLQEHGMSEEDVRAIWNDVDEDYFLREPVTDIVWHTLAIRDHDLDSGPLIAVRDDVSTRGEEGATHIFVYTPRAESLFAAIVTALDMLNINVVDARIAGSRDNVYDTFMVLESDGTPVGHKPGRIEQIRKTISEHIGKRGDFEAPANRRTPRVLKQFDLKTEVTISNDANNEHTVLEVITPDRPGLLAIVANLFSEMDIVVQSAKITTLGERVEDVFYIADGNNQPISDPGFCEQLNREIRERLDYHVKEVVD